MSDPEPHLNLLIAAAQRGDRSALESLLLQIHDPILAYLRQSMRATPAPAPAPGSSPGSTAGGASAPGLAPEDILQETLIEVSRNIRTFEPRGENSFFAWVRTIARSRLLNQIKAANAQKRGGPGVSNPKQGPDRRFVTAVFDLLASADPTASRVAQRREALEAMGKALAALDADKRQVLSLRFAEDRSIPDVARQIGKSTSAVKMMIQRSVQELRRQMEATGDFTAGL